MSITCPSGGVTAGATAVAGKAAGPRHPRCWSTGSERGWGGRAAVCGLRDVWLASGRIICLSQPVAMAATFSSRDGDCEEEFQLSGVQNCAAWSQAAHTAEPGGQSAAAFRASGCPGSSVLLSPEPAQTRGILLMVDVEKSF